PSATRSPTTSATETATTATNDSPPPNNDSGSPPDDVSSPTKTQGPLVVAPVSSFWFAGSGPSRSKESSSWWATMEAIGVAASAKRIVIGAEDRRELERLVRSRTAERRAVERARIVLAAAEGRSAARIAGEVGCSERTVWKWRRRFEAEGVAGLVDAPRPGRPLVHGPRTRAKLIALACTTTTPLETPSSSARTRLGGRGDPEPSRPERI